MIGGRVLDTSAVLTAATGTNDYTAALLTVAAAHGIVLAVPAGAVQGAWRGTRPAERAWLELLLDSPAVVVVPLAADDARDAGLLAADAGHDDSTAATAHAVHLARRRGWTVLTADPGPVLELDPQVHAETIP